MRQVAIVDLHATEVCNGVAALELQGNHESKGSVALKTCLQ